MIGVPDPTVGAVGEGDRRAAPTARRSTADELVAHCKDRMASYKKPKSSSSSTRCRAPGFAVDYDALDAEFGGGGYPGGNTRSV